MTLSEIKRANRAGGFHFFEPDTMRFFDSRILGQVFGSFFVTSERFSLDDPRLYTIRQARGDGSIETVGDFQQYPSANAAYAVVRTLGRKS